MTRMHGGGIGSRRLFRHLPATVYDFYIGVSRTAWKAIGVLVILTVVFSIVIVRDLSNPLIGKFDTETWLFQSNYFAKHTHFTPLPQIDFETDDVFYPYGVSNVFRPWHFESSYFYAAFYRLFGHGPWLQWYYVASVFLCGVMAYFVVRGEFGARWALLAAVIATSAAAPASADKPTLTIYTYSSFVSEWGPGPALQPLFEAQCGCSINWVSLEDGAAT